MPNDAYRLRRVRRENWRVKDHCSDSVSACLGKVKGFGWQKDCFHPFPILWRSCVVELVAGLGFWEKLSGVGVGVEVLAHHRPSKRVLQLALSYLTNHISCLQQQVVSYVQTWGEEESPIEPSRFFLGGRGGGGWNGGIECIWWAGRLVLYEIPWAGPLGEIEMPPGELFGTGRIKSFISRTEKDNGTSFLEFTDAALTRSNENRRKYGKVVVKPTVERWGSRRNRRGRECLRCLTSWLVHRLRIEVI